MLFFKLLRRLLNKLLRRRSNYGWEGLEEAWDRAKRVRMLAEELALRLHSEGAGDEALLLESLVEELEEVEKLLAEASLMLTSAAARRPLETRR